MAISLLSEHLTSSCSNCSRSIDFSQEPIGRSGRLGFWRCRPRYPNGRGSGLKHRPVWVRIPPGAPRDVESGLLTLESGEMSRLEWSEPPTRPSAGGAAVGRGHLVDRVAHPVDAQGVRGAGDARRRAGDDDDELTLLDPADLEQL